MNQTDPSITSTSPESATESAEHFLDRVLNDKQHPLVIFTREACVYCRAALKFFAAIEAPYRIVKLDSKEYRTAGLNREIHAILLERSHSHTVPQIFIAGQFAGGATDSFDAWHRGDFQQKLRAAAVPFKEPAGLNPNTFLFGGFNL